MKDYYDPGFNGTDCYWRYPFGKGFAFTDSVKYFCDTHQAYWVLDVIASYMPKIGDLDFVVLTFEVNGNECDFAAKEDDGLPNLVKQHIEYTDLKVSIRLYLDNGVLMFPSDY